jgi:hypothetical protein
MVMKRPMVAFLTQLLLAIRSRFTRRARLWNLDRLLFVWLYRLYPALLDAIMIVQPETVIRWHRRGFRAYWRWQSRHVGGLRRTRYRGLDRTQLHAYLVAAAYNLLRIARLSPAPA